MGKKAKIFIAVCAVLALALVIIIAKYAGKNSVNKEDASGQMEVYAPGESDAPSREDVYDETEVDPEPEFYRIGTDVTVYKTASAGSETRILQEGTECFILRTEGDWIRIELVEDSTTWYITEEALFAEPEFVWNDAHTYPLTYVDDTCSVAIDRIDQEGTTCYLARVKLTDFGRFFMEPANGTYGGGIESVSQAAERTGAVLAVCGDNQPSYKIGGSARHGVATQDGSCTTTLLYSAASGTFIAPVDTPELYTAALSEVVEGGYATDTINGGALLLYEDELFEIGDYEKDQKALIGTTGEPGEILFLVTEGELSDGTSEGLTWNACAQIMKKSGCKTAAPLDRGSNVSLYFNGEVINTAVLNEPPLYDFAIVR